MADQATEEKTAEPAKKSGSKITIVAICVVMLITGGFAGLKLRSSGKNKAAASAPIKIELAKELVPLKEFLVNLGSSGDSKIYLRIEIAVQLAKDYKKEAFTTYDEAIRDAVNGVLRGYTVDEIANVKGTGELKRRLAAAINNRLHELEPDGWKGPALDHDKDYDSDIGPVYKVYLASIAYQ